MSDSFRESTIRRLVRVGFTASLVVLASCRNSGEAADATLDAPDPYVTMRFRAYHSRDIDLLWVIDDSPGMIELQNEVKLAFFPGLISELDDTAGGLPDIHIGVVTTDLGTSATADGSPGPPIGSGPGSCAGTGKAGNLQINGSTVVQGNFISDVGIGGTRAKNYTGDIVSAFAALASVGASGCEFEQPLQAATRAFSSNPYNAGFRRPTARLAVIFVGDEDDCSLAHSALLGADTTSLGPLTSFRCTRFGVTCDRGGTTPDQMATPGVKSDCHSNERSPALTRVADHASFLESLALGPENVLVATIAGDPAPLEVISGPSGPALEHSCASTSFSAAPGVRLDDLAARFPHHVVGSACGNLTTTMTTIAHEIREILPDPCLLGDLALPLDCTVTIESDGVTTPIPVCDASLSVKPCWHSVTDPNVCSAGSHTRGVVEYSDGAPPPQDMVMTFRCRR